MGITHSNLSWLRTSVLLQTQKFCLWKFIGMHILIVKMAILYSIMFCFSSTVIGMNFNTIAIQEGVAIQATGPIEIGDAVKLLSLFPQATLDQQGLRRIILESPGGDVAEAMRIAELIRANDFMTLVAGECASACSMVLYPAGRYFILLDGGKLGFHSCYDGRNQTERPECTEAIATLAAKNGFPYGSIKVFASLAGPTDIYWVTNVLAYCYGMERLVGDPEPVTVSTLCPSVISALIEANYREPNRPLGPSFDCRKASTPVAHLLCRDSELMHLDAIMGELYRMLRHREGDTKSELLLAQRAWIVTRDQKCSGDVNAEIPLEKIRDAARCVSEMTMDRMDALLESNGTPRQDLSSLINAIRQKAAP